MGGNHAQQMQGIGIARVHLQNLSVDRFRLLQIARLMVRTATARTSGLLPRVFCVH